MDLEILDEEAVRSSYGRHCHAGKGIHPKRGSQLVLLPGALLPEHQQALDELFVHAEYLVAAITMAEHMPRTEALHLGMLVGVTRDLLRLQQRVTELEAINRERS